MCRIQPRSAACAMLCSVRVVVLPGIKPQPARIQPVRISNRPILHPNQLLAPCPARNEAPFDARLRRAQIRSKTVFWHYNLNQVHCRHGVLFLLWGNGHFGATHNSRPTLFRGCCFDFLVQQLNFGVTRDRGPRCSPLVSNELGLELWLAWGCPFT